MQLRLVVWILGIALAVPGAGWADPPDHAPAHGYRSKEKPTQHDTGGFAVAFDSERGVHMAVDFPDVYFEAGKYYRYVDGGWRVSARADGGWSIAVSGHVPAAIQEAHKHSPGPAKAHRQKLHKKKHDKR